jgi:dTDP-4-dehydrorhamnose 3,5-epimerase
MRFHPTALQGAILIEPTRIEDERGFFARTWCRDECRAHGIPVEWVQCNISFNKHAGTLRGMHYQAPPHTEGKLVRCTRGSAHDVILDLRPGSPTFGRWVAVELSEDNRLMLYIPEGLAHGFQTLTDGTELSYQMSAFYHPQAARGVRWDDPTFAIVWPKCAVRILSAADASYPDFVAAHQTAA